VWDGKVQAVQNDRDFLAVLGGEDVVEEGGFAGTKVACQRDESADAADAEEGPCMPVTIVMGTLLPAP
jgi:hypothetical protein